MSDDTGTTAPRDDDQQSDDGQQAPSGEQGSGPVSQPNETAGDPTAEKDPSTWVTGGEPATGAQKSYLATLATEAGRDVPAEPSKAEASELIDELKDQSSRVSKG